MQTTPAQATQTGLQAAQQSADSNGLGWTEVALNALVKYAALAPKPFTIEQARLWLDDIVPPPKDGRAWGSVASQAVHKRLIRKTGQFAPAVSSHNSPKPTYVAG